MILAFCCCFMDRLELVEACSTINSGSMADVVGQWIGYKVRCNVKSWLSGVMLAL
jgi:hypothetical protein